LKQALAFPALGAVTGVGGIREIGRWPTAPLVQEGLNWPRQLRMIGGKEREKRRKANGFQNEIRCVG
jgi:hypothetical protein